MIFFTDLIICKLEHERFVAADDVGSTLSSQTAHDETDDVADRSSSPLEVDESSSPNGFKSIGYSTMLDDGLFSRNFIVFDKVSVFDREISQAESFMFVWTAF